MAMNTGVSNTSANAEMTMSAARLHEAVEGDMSGCDTSISGSPLTLPNVDLPEMTCISTGDINIDFPRGKRSLIRRIVACMPSRCGITIRLTTLCSFMTFSISLMWYTGSLMSSEVGESEVGLMYPTMLNPWALAGLEILSAILMAACVTPTISVL